MSYALASNCALQKLDENKIELSLSSKHQAMLNPKLKERIVEALSRHFNRPIQLEILITNTEIETPVKQQQQENAQQLSSAKQSLMEDPKIKQLLDMYDGTLEVSLV
jgi:DNA polymerase-3 subunit gamma/tau